MGASRGGQQTSGAAVVSPDRRSALGRRAEALAAACLEEQGCRILARNWRRREGELDLVALAPDGTCVFCEVRSRTGNATGEPLEAIGARKRAQVIRVSRIFLAEEPLPPGLTGFRYDVVAVTFALPPSEEAEVVHLARAFETT
jgi:putative endonuclease